MSVRRPAVAGQFYPADPLELKELIDWCYLHPLGPGRTPPERKTNAPLVAVVCPHAGYVYSGPVAAHSFLHASSLRDPELIVVVAPNHYGIGSGVSTFRSGQWETPLGKLTVDSAAAAKLADIAEIVSFDPEAHRLEHSLEVQLPFIQRIYGDSVPFLPISLLFQDVDTAKTMAAAVAKLLRGKRAVLVASSDLTHYEPAEEAKRKDLALLEKVLEFDMEGFYSTLESLNVTSCGFGAIATVMGAAKELGLSHAELLKYATSGDTSGDNLQVVGYGALRFE